MTSTFTTITIGASPVQVPVAPEGGGLTKLGLQAGRQSTGIIKVGQNSSLTTDDSTGGIYLSYGTPGPGSAWSVEDQTGRDSIYSQQYYVHGTVPGDVVMVEFNQG